MIANVVADTTKDMMFGKKVRKKLISLIRINIMKHSLNLIPLKAMRKFQLR